MIALCSVADSESTLGRGDSPHHSLHSSCLSYPSRSAQLSPANRVLGSSTVVLTLILIFVFLLFFSFIFVSYFTLLKLSAIFKSSQCYARSFEMAQTYGTFCWALDFILFCESFFVKVSTFC